MRVSCQREGKPGLPGCVRAYHATTAFIAVEVDGVVQYIDIVGFSPILRILELFERILHIPSSST